MSAGGRSHVQFAAVEQAVAAAGWRGVALPRTRVSGYLVYPVVQVDAAGWLARIDGGPVLDRAELARGVYPSPLRITGFVSTARFRRALQALEWLAGYGPGLVLVDGVYPPATLKVCEADLYDVSLAWRSSDGPVRLILRGPDTPAPGTDGASVAMRVKEEALFAHALNSVQGGEPGC